MRNADERHTWRRKFGRSSAATAGVLPLLFSHLACSESAPDVPRDAPVAWSVTLGGEGSHRVEGIAADGAGNIFAAGTISGELELEDGTRQADSDDAFLGKWDSEGRLSWLKTFGGEDLDQAHGVAVDAHGNVYITGSFTRDIDFGTGPLETEALQAIFLAKLDGNGEPLWATGWGTEDFQSACCVEVGSDGKVVIAGDFGTALNLGGDDLTSAGSSDVFLAVLDEDGAHLHSKSFGDAALQRVTGLALDGDGNISLLGTFQGVLDFGGNEITGGEGTFEALYVAKLDSRLNHIWSRKALQETQRAEHAHGQAERAHSLAPDLDSNLLVQASYSSGPAGGGQDFEAPAEPHGVLVQYGRDGDLTRSRALGRTGTQDEGAVALDANGNRWLAVSFLQDIDVDGTGELGSTGGRDIALIELDERNELVRSLRHGEPARSEIAWDMLVSEGVVTVGGWSRKVGEIGRDLGVIVQFQR